MSSDSGFACGDVMGNTIINKTNCSQNSFAICFILVSPLVCESSMYIDVVGPENVYKTSLSDRFFHMSERG
jgi:hypothetical protein